jgi:hypothetical protein
MLRDADGHKNLHRRLRTEQNKKQRIFAFSAKNWVLVCGELFGI